MNTIMVLSFHEGVLSILTVIKSEVLLICKVILDEIIIEDISSMLYKHLSAHVIGWEG